MKGAGYFKQLVLGSPWVIAESLDKVPMDGPVSMSQLQGYLKSMLQLRGVAIATATRLLAVKRPIVFFRSQVGASTKHTKHWDTLPLGGVM
jgi:hypothetical protein